MPRVNHDASVNRLIAKYGVPGAKKARRHTTEGIAKTIRKIKVPGADSHWLKVHREFLRWKKTDEYKTWRKNQYGKQAGLCYYCDVPLKGIRTNVEHVRPKSKGGDNNTKNLVLACWKCNKTKHADVLPKKKIKQLKHKHTSKQRAFQEDISFALDLYDRL